MVPINSSDYSQSLEPLTHVSDDQWAQVVELVLDLTLGRRGVEQLARLLLQGQVRRINGDVRARRMRFQICLFREL